MPATPVLTGNLCNQSNFPLKNNGTIWTVDESMAIQETRMLFTTNKVAEGIDDISCCLHAETKEIADHLLLVLGQSCLKVNILHR